MGVAPTVFEIFMHKARKQLVFPTPLLFDALLRETRHNFWIKLAQLKLE